MATIYYDKDADLAQLKDEKIAIVGYGSQGHAHAQNLKESGLSVIVADLPGSENWKQAEKDGLEVKTVAEAAAEARVIMLLIGDNDQPPVFQRDILPHLTDGKALAVAHGFNIVFN